MEGKMKAVALHAIKDLRYEDVNIPTIGADDVLVKVKYVGICGSDMPRAMVSGAYHYPTITGHEFSGQVVEIGNNVDDIKVGERVTVAPLIPCGECEFCKKGNFALCETYEFLGSRNDGGFAEYVRVPKENILILPEDLDYETAAGIEPASISYQAMSKTGIKVGDTVAVVGCGPIGQFAIQWAKIFGASKVIAVDVLEDKLKLAKELGADIVVNSKECNAVEKVLEITNGGVEAVVETAGMKITEEQSVLMCRKLGKVVFLGISHDELRFSEKTFDRIMRGEIALQGSWNSYAAPFPGIAWRATLDFMEKGQIVFKPMISHKIKLEELPGYFHKMFNKEINYNKVLVEI